MPQEPIRHGDVYGGTYAFPHENAAVGGTGEGAEKQRPILILQNAGDNQNVPYPRVQATPITTQKTDRVYVQDVLLPAGEANLPQTSKVLLGLAQPLLKIRLGQRSGQVSPAKMREVDIKLLRLFGFSAKHS